MMKQLLKVVSISLLFGCLISSNLFAQHQDKYMHNKIGTAKVESNLFQYKGAERIAFEKSLKKVADWLIQNNEILAQKKGFDLLVTYFGTFMDYYKLRPCNYGLVSQMEFAFQLFIKDNDKETKWTIEPPHYPVYINSTNHGSYRFQQEVHFNELKDDASIKVPLEKVLCDLNDLRVVFPLIREIVPGVRLYGDGNLVVYNPYRPEFWIPVKLKEIVEMKQSELVLRKDNFLLPELLKEIASLSAQELNAPAYQGDEKNFVINANGRSEGLQIMKFNKDYWNRSLPKSAVQFIAMYYNPKNDIEKQEYFMDNGHPNYPGIVAEAMKLNELSVLIEK